MLGSAPFQACDEHGLPTAASKKDAMEAGNPYTFDYFSTGNARLVFLAIDATLALLLAVMLGDACSSGAEAVCDVGFPLL